jgi:hypothetical protein
MRAAGTGDEQGGVDPLHGGREERKIKEREEEEAGASSI